MVMTHGDDRGVVVPPRLAPVQTVIVPIYKKADERGPVVEKAHELRVRLGERGVRAKVDDRDHLNPGAKYYEWERKGVPVRIEIGPRDLAKQQVVLVKRVTPEGEERKLFLGENEAVDTMPALLEVFQKDLLDRARTFRESNSHRGVRDMGELKELLEGPGGFVYTGWSGDPAVEERVKEETKGTLRCIPDSEFQSPQAPERCLGGGESKMEVVWAKAY
jgi:prolyl-tRNA synthetase